MTTQYFDEEEIRKTIAIMKPDGQLFECRMLEGSKTYSGYFTDANTLINALRRERLQGRSVYITLNEINIACFSRVQRDCFIQVRKEPTTSDTDIIGYNWLMIDLDPKRPSGTASSDEEIQSAKDIGNRIYISLKNMGFEKPLTAYSGNGVHLLYKIHIANTEEMRELVKKCLNVLSVMFGTDRVDVDTKNFNPARITKFYGVRAAKGADTEDRPHRMSRIIGSFEDHENIKVTDIAYLRKLASLIPEEPDKPQRYNNYNSQEFDVEQWMGKYGIGYRKMSAAGGTKYVLDHCPFNENHKGKDAVVFRRDNGALAFVCLHASCADYHWKEFRQHFEPTAYERDYQEREKKMYYSFNRDRTPPKPKPIEQKEDGDPIFLTAEMILAMDRPEETFVRTGITQIDRRLRGLKKGYVSVWSGLRASAKSTVLSEIVLNAVETGNNVGVYSGELTAPNFLKWMMLQAAGKGYNKPSQHEGYYYTPKDTQKQIAKWLGQHFWLYNNDYGNNFVAIMEQFERRIDENKLDLLVLDNLMAFDITDLSPNKWDAQSQFVLTLTALSKRKNCHIAFVAHPKKSMGFLRFDDISGTADLGNAVDDAFIVHRNNNDFKRLSQQMFDWHDDNEIYKGTNVIEIVKDRDGGTQDVFIPLYYEVESKRLKNYVAENVIYGWNEEKKEIEVDLDLDGFEEMSDGQTDPFG